MASGDPTLVHHGVYSISSAGLKTAVDAITNHHPLLSGASLHFLPNGAGQVGVVEIKIEGTG